MRNITSFFITKKYVFLLFALTILLSIIFGLPGSVASGLNQDDQEDVIYLDEEKQVLFDPTQKIEYFNTKLDDSVANLVEAAKVSPQRAISLADLSFFKVIGDMVEVHVITSAENLEAACQAIIKSGGEVKIISHDNSFMQVWLPVNEIETLTKNESIFYISRPSISFIDTDAGAWQMHNSREISEGFSALNGGPWHEAGYKGKGVRIAIIDGGFFGYKDLLGTDLPSSVIVKNFVEGENPEDVDNGDVHGTGVAEIIHDIAPLAQLYFAKTNRPLEWQNAVDWAIENDVDIINTSLHYFLGPGDGSGFFADLAKKARDHGILWVKSAGNARQRHWAGSYTPGSKENLHYWAPGKTVKLFANTIPANTTISGYLRWDDWTNVDQDYSLHLVEFIDESNWEIIPVEGGEQPQTGEEGQTPVEEILFTTKKSGKYGFIISRVDSNRNVHFDFFASHDIVDPVHDRSITPPGDNPLIMTVGAISWQSPYAHENYSSQGPTNGPGGVPDGGIIKPDISAYAGVTTVSYGPDKFYGTSAAAPHVAGAAALVLDAFPDMSPDQLQNYMQTLAVDMGAPGKDNVFGHGRLFFIKAPTRRFEIINPTETTPTYAGKHNAVQKTIVEITKPKDGLTINDFQVKIGDKIANIVTLYEGSDVYVLEIMPPIMEKNGSYNLLVVVDTKPGTHSKKEINAVYYADISNVDIELVIDRSGSMAGTPITLAKQAASQFVDFMHYGDMVGVVSFSSTATTNYALNTIVDESIKVSAKSAINSISATGNTSIGSGLKRAQDQLLESGNNNHPWSIILLTDGQENQSPYVATVLPDIVASKTVVHTVGLGSANQAQLLDIATQTGGTYNYAPTPQQLAEIYNTISGTVSNQQILHASTGIVDKGSTDIKQVVIDSTVSDATFSISWSNSSSTIDLTLKKPDGTTISPSSASSNDDIEFVSGPTYQYYRIKQPTMVSGVWEMHISGGSIASSFDKEAATDQNRAETYTLRVTANTSLTTQFYLDKDTYLTYEPIKLVATISDSQPIIGATVKTTINLPSGLTREFNELEWIEINGDTMPDPELFAALEARAAENRATLVLYDDGQHGDGAANDGVYANYFRSAYDPGTYSFSISAEGVSTSGETFTRLANLSTYIAENPNPSVDEFSVFFPLILNNANPNTFTIRPVLIEPTDGAVLNTLVPTLSWKINRSLHPLTWFYYWISSNPNFNDYDEWGSEWSDYGSLTSWWNLEPGTTYYWYAAYDYWTGNSWEYGPTTPVRSFTTGSGGSFPAAPNLVSPKDDATSVMPPVTLSWNPVSGAVEYQMWLCFEYDPPYWGCYIFNTTNSSLNLPSDYFEPNTLYEWTVKARNKYGWGSESYPWYFTTGAFSFDRDQQSVDMLENFYIKDESGKLIPFKTFETKHLFGGE